MTKSEISQALVRAGLQHGQPLVKSTTTWSWPWGRDLLFDPGIIVARHQGVVWQGGLQLSKYGWDLHGVASGVDETLFVVRYEDAFTNGEVRPLRELLQEALWWTSNLPEKYLPLEDYRQWHRKRPPEQIPPCTDSRNWMGTLWLAEETVETSWLAELSTTKGRAVIPSLLHRSGVHELVWFNNGQAVLQPAYEQLRANFDRMQFTVHRDKQAIHVRQDEKVVALIWPCQVPNPRTAWLGRRELFLRGKPPDSAERLKAYVIAHLDAASSQGPGEDLWQCVNRLNDRLKGIKCTHVSWGGVTEWSKCDDVEINGVEFVFEGTNVWVTSLFHDLMNGKNVREFLTAHPTVSRRQVELVLDHIILSMNV